MKLKKLHIDFIKEIVENEPQSVYDIAKSLGSDYGNTNKRAKELLKDGLISEFSRIKGKTNNDKIIYDITEKGFVRYFIEYIKSEDNFCIFKPNKKIEQYRIHVKRIFSKYSDFFPNISKNIHFIMSDDLDEYSIVPFYITSYALPKACRAYQKNLEDESLKIKLPDSIEIPDSMLNLERDLVLGLNKPIQLTSSEIFESEFIKYFILEPPISLIKGFFENNLFLIRLTHIFNESDELKEMVLDYFVKKEMMYSDYANYYKILSESELEIDND